MEETGPSNTYLNFASLHMRWKDCPSRIYHQENEISDAQTIGLWFEHKCELWFYSTSPPFTVQNLMFDAPGVGIICNLSDQNTLGVKNNAKYDSFCFHYF